jgi:type VI secretion system protein ImpM
MTARMAMPGFFGKLPARGDFVQAGLSRRFIDRWDGWLQGMLPACRAALGDDWDTVWGAALPWRFALSGNGLGSVLGVLLPSVDRTGRHFPLTIAAEGAHIDPNILDPNFLDEAEAIGLIAVAGRCAPDTLAARLKTMPLPPAAADGGEPADACLWWSGTAPATTLATLPDGAQFARMLAAGRIEA